MIGHSLQSQQAAYCPSQQGTIKACTNTYPLQLTGRLSGLDLVLGSQGDIDPITEKVFLSLSLEDGTGTEVRHLPEQLLLASPEIADEREPFHP